MKITDSEEVVECSVPNPLDEWYSDPTWRKEFWAAVKVESAKYKLKLPAKAQPEPK